jgi:DNA-binding IclR family transcriptional regulator
MKPKGAAVPTEVDAPINAAAVRSVGRTIDILEELANNPRGIGLLDLSKRTGLHKSTVHRLLSVLIDRGYVQKADRGQGYTLGLHMVELANSYLNSLDLKIEARLCMYELTEATRHTVFLALLHGRDVVYIDKTETFSSLRRFSIIGTRVPVHCTSLGKALLMDRSQDDLAEFFHGYDFKSLTPNTVTSRDAFFRSLEACRSRGYTVDDEEHERGVRCVGAPVYDYAGGIIAAVSLSGLADTIPREKIPELGNKIMQTAQEISLRMGYPGRKKIFKESLPWKSL